jgi:DNA-binding CsgD family transcriptional regulator/tetratricopeptide (TPR) repeat protein
LGEAEAAGLLAERRGALGSELWFVHPLVHRAVYDDLPLAERRRLHARAAELVDRPHALDHRVAAAAAADPGLADELEQAAGEATAAGRVAKASSWLAHAAALSADGGDRERRLLGALEQLLLVGDVAGATALEPAVRGLGASARASGLLGHLALLRGDGMSAERLLLGAWERHDRASEPRVGAAAAVQLTQFYTVAGRAAEGLAWGQRAIDSVEDGSELWLAASTQAAAALAFLGRPAEGVELLRFLPRVAGEAPVAASDALVYRGIVRLWSDEVGAAIRDLETAAARMREGAPMRFASQCLALLGDASFRVGAWDHAVVHTELAVSLSRDADRVWDLPFVHGYAAIVPACRGEWEVAFEHVQAALATAAPSRMALPIAISNTAAAMLAAARADHVGVLEATAAIRATGRVDAIGRPGVYNWRALEVEALIAGGRRGEAQTALDELEAAIPAGGLHTADVEVARLQGMLAAARRDHDVAADRFAAARRLSEGLQQPFELALLALADGRRLLHAGDRRAAIARLRDAREGFTKLGARPYVEACGRDLEKCGVRTGRHGPAAGHGLTPAELAVARLVATGKTNRQTAAELYVTVKTVEFHLRSVFAKLGISSRSQIAARLGTSPGE